MNEFMINLAVGALVSIAISAMGILFKLHRIADALDKIARNATEEIRVSIPNNKTVRMDLPDGGTISGPIGRDRGAE